MRVGCLGFLCSPSIAAEKEPYLCANLAVLGHKTKEDEEATVSALPRTVAITTKGPCPPLSQHSLVLLSSS